MSTPISGRRIGRAVLAGPLPTFQKPIYACALVGEIPDRLSINFTARLASASLVSPDGGGPTEDQWRSALVTLARANRLTLDEDRRVTPEALSAVLPDLKAAGLEPGEALLAWLRDAESMSSEAAPVPAQEGERTKAEKATPQVKSDADEFQKRVSGDLKKKLKPLNFPARVKQGAEALGATVELGQVPYSAPTVIEALILLQVLPEAARGDKDTATAIRTYYKSEGVEWKSRARADRSAAEQLVRCYREGERIAEEQSKEALIYSKPGIMLRSYFALLP